MALVNIKQLGRHTKQEQLYFLCVMCCVYVYVCIMNINIGRPSRLETPSFSREAMKL